MEPANERSCFVFFEVEPVHGRRRNKWVEVAYTDCPLKRKFKIPYHLPLDHRFTWLTDIGTWSGSLTRKVCGVLDKLAAIPNWHCYCVCSESEVEHFRVLLGEIGFRILSAKPIYSGDCSGGKISAEQERLSKLAQQQQSPTIR